MIWKPVAWADLRPGKTYRYQHVGLRDVFRVPPDEYTAHGELVSFYDPGHNQFGAAALVVSDLPFLERHGERMLVVVYERGHEYAELVE